MTMLEEALEGLTPPSPELVIEVLERASKLIQNDGWCQGAGHTFKQDETTGRLVYTGHCLVGATSQAALLVETEKGLSPLNYLWGRASDLLRAATPGGNVPVYNDAPGRTQAEVLDVLQTALDRARGF